MEEEDKTEEKKRHESKKDLKNGPNLPEPGEIFFQPRLIKDLSNFFDSNIKQRFQKKLIIRKKYDYCAR